MDEETLMLIAVVIAVLVAVASLAALGYLMACERAAVDPRGRTSPASVMVVLGSGGHTAEMLTLVRQLGGNYSPRHYVLASNDTISEEKVRRLEDDREQGEQVINSTKGTCRPAGNTKGSTGCQESPRPAPPPYSISKIPRSRAVSQSWASTVFTTLYAAAYSVPLVLRRRPDLLMCNGPGTCVPLCLAALLLKPFRPVTVVYVESVCRVETLSLSGKILYYFADEMFVQWRSLQKKYPKTKYLGRLV